MKYGRCDETSVASGRPEIVVSAKRDGDAVAIEVSDHGPGIPGADRSRAVQRFVRLEGARSRPGFGLGLSLAAAVIRMHGGSVRLEDNAPGLRVHASLPASAAALPSPSAAKVAA